MKNSSSSSLRDNLKGFDSTGKLSPEFIIFDMDGTLYPDNPEIIRHYGECAIDLLAQQMNMAAADAEKVMQEARENLAAALGGKPTNSLTLMSRFDIPFEVYAREVNSRQQIETLLQTSKAHVEAVEKIAAEYPVYLYTTNNSISADRILRAIGMDHIFPLDRRFTLSDIFELDLPRSSALKLIKPGLDGFRHILKLNGFSAEETMMVGDSEVSDIEPAKKLGMATWHVREMEDLAALAEMLVGE
ncbi:MAG: hypothetical protein CVV64_14975 [Candidatus Wallbacteria bacterium HGW-Wallbacteria-1]|jgi:FMN phosphatase YigB (HAD superfamily)|uniref:HAD family hydrolase n=1 Tax=Candidatus Wallbacteria bacterium HGW-Wallbacteria-1 TaxID=2013854 RepID=A0A2N1PLT4_9BACT|nr:MAG: hypothetical protein CVV64_14975 [Candidatus Wallbacteria bacterium HGW-Wallbacteria-1]